jgi:arsenate reductase (thioredoxin)
MKKKKIIFICVGNSCRSQMAEGFAKHYARQKNLDVEIRSAGTHPAGYVHPDAIAVMREKGIDITDQ